MKKIVQIYRIFRKKKREKLNNKNLTWCLSSFDPAGSNGLSIVHNLESVRRDLLDRAKSVKQSWHASLIFKVFLFKIEAS